MVWKLGLDPSIKNWAYLRIDSLKCYTVRVYQNVLKWRGWTGLELVFLPHSVHDFWGKLFLIITDILFFIITDQVLLPDCLLFFEILGKMWIVINSFPVCDIMNFEILTFLSSCFPKWPKNQGKHLSSLRMKKAFSIIFIWRNIHILLTWLSELSGFLVK